MDRNNEWPWSWEEEAEWKTELQERDDSFLEEMLEDAVEEVVSGSPVARGSQPQEQPATQSAPEKYLVTA